MNGLAHHGIRCTQRIAWSDSLVKPVSEPLQSCCWCGVCASQPISASSVSTALSLCRRRAFHGGDTSTRSQLSSRTAIRFLVSLDSSWSNMSLVVVQARRARDVRGPILRDKELAPKDALRAHVVVSTGSRDRHIHLECYCSTLTYRSCRPCHNHEDQNGKGLSTVVLHGC